MAATGIFLALLQAFLTSRLVPVLAGDESFFKGVAYEISANTHYALPLASGYYRLIETRFRAYPPLFFLLLAGWFKVVGFGALQNHAFAAILRVICAILGGGLAGRLAARRKGLVASVAAVAIFSYARLDRPDHLASLLALAAVWLLLDPARTPGRVISMTVIALGALLVMPAATMLYGVLFVVFVARTGPSRPLVKAALAALALFLVAQAALYLLSPDLYFGFVRSCLLRLVNRPVRAPEWLAPSGAMLWVPWFVLHLLFLPMWLKRARTLSEPGARGLGALFWATTASLAVWAAVTPDSYVYFMLLFPFVVATSLASASRLSGARGVAALALIACAMAAAWMHSTLDIARALAMRDEDRYERAAAAIRDTIPAGSVVLADGPLWTALIQRYDFYDLAFGLRQIGSARYVVATGLGTGRPGISVFEASGLWAPRQFRLVYDGLLPEPQRLLGIRLGRSRLGYGVRIFERIAPPPR